MFECGFHAPARGKDKVSPTDGGVGTGRLPSGRRREAAGLFPWGSSLVHALCRPPSERSIRPGLGLRPLSDPAADYHPPPFSFRSAKGRTPHGEANRRHVRGAGPPASTKCLQRAGASAAQARRVSRSPSPSIPRRSLSRPSAPPFLSAGGKGIHAFGGWPWRPSFGASRGCVRTCGHGIGTSNRRILHTRTAWHQSTGTLWSFSLGIFFLSFNIVSSTVYFVHTALVTALARERYIQ